MKNCKNEKKKEMKRETYRLKESSRYIKKITVNDSYLDLDSNTLGGEHHI